MLSAALTALEPSATAALLKAPGASGLGADTAGKRKARPSIKALQPDKPPPFTPVPGVPAASSAAATTRPDAVRGSRSPCARTPPRVEVVPAGASYPACTCSARG